MTILEIVDKACGALADPGNDCDGCGTQGSPGMPGVLAPCLPDGDASHAFVERCDSCQRYASDEAAAISFATRAGLIVHRRYDSEERTTWRVFVTTPGAPDDTDLYGIGADTFGCFPTSEVAV